MVVSCTRMLRAGGRSLVGRGAQPSSPLLKAAASFDGTRGGPCQQLQRQTRCTSSSAIQRHPQPRRALSSRTFSLSGRRRLASQTSSAANATETQPTLFSLPNLLHPSDFARLATDAIRECDAVRKIVAASLSEDPTTLSLEEQVHKAKETLHLLDDISNIVCTVIDAAELCRSVHADPQWRRGASDAFGILSEYIGSLNADDRLYFSLRKFVFLDDGKGDEAANGTADGEATNAILARLPPEYQRMAHAMRKEFERDGIHLTYTKREEARELNNVIVGLESLFTNNITEKTKYYDVHGTDLVGEVDRIIPRHVLGQLVRPAEGTTCDGKERLTLSSDNLLSNTLLAHSPSAALRKEVYMQTHTSVPENLAVLDALIKHRHLHSTLLGYQSYAHRVLSDRMVGTPEKVQEFLRSMGERSKHVFQRDMEAIQRAKRHVEGGGDIEPWDLPFYTAQLKAARQHERMKEEEGADSDGDEESQFHGYFTVENSVNGMKVLVEELFGIAMEEVEIPLEERWDLDAAVAVDEQASKQGGGLRKFEFRHEEEGPLGTMYLDLHPRDGKFNHAAHFTIRCGRIRNDVSDTREGAISGNNHQLPIVALVCNLSPAASCPSQTLLSHAEVETLYHEFGHGLHSLLSRTSFQHLSGTRAAMDFVETPSHLFESFSRDPGFLSRVLARHCVTGQPLSEHRARHLAASHADFRGVEVQTQLVHSLFDQALFGEDPCCPSLGGASSTEVFERLHSEANVPFAPGTHWHSRFGHLVTYGAGYYGYLYAQTFAADIWKSTLASSMTSESSTALKEGGTKIWKEMLVHGGAKDPKDMIREVLEREPSVDPFFEGFR